MDRLSMKYLRGVDERKLLTVGENVFDFDDFSRQRLSNAYIALQGTNNVITWTTFDDRDVELSASDIKEIFTAAVVRADELHEKYRKLKEKLENGEEVEW